MPIVDYRIDDRLIHGQVYNFWIKVLNANKILIIDDEIAENNLRSNVLKMGCPSYCTLIIKSVCEAKRLLSKYNGESRLLIIVNNPSKYLELVKQGYKMDYITVGNMANVNGSTPITKTVFITEDDRKTFCELVNYGIEIYSQMVPDDKRENISSWFGGNK